MNCSFKKEKEMVMVGWYCGISIVTTRTYLQPWARSVFYHYLDWTGATAAFLGRIPYVVTLVSLSHDGLDGDLTVVGCSQHPSKPVASFRFPAHAPHPLGIFAESLE